MAKRNISAIDRGINLLLTIECLKRGLEPIGMSLLLGAFIWQTASFYYSEKSKSEQLYNIERALDHILSSECDEALRDSARYQGNACMRKDYDGMLAFLDTYCDKGNQYQHDDKAFTAWFIQFLMYFFGSISLILAKIIEINKKQI